MLSNKGAPPVSSRRISRSGSRHQSSAQQQQQLQAQRAAAAASAAAAVKRLSGRDLEHLQQLHTFFCSLGDDMAAAVQRLALQGFNQWLVSNALACSAEQFDERVVSVHCSSAVWLLCMALPCVKQA
jgi:phosphoserine phosphatase